MSCGSAHDVLLLETSTIQPWSLSAQTPVVIWQVDFDLSASCSYAGGDCCPDAESMVLSANGAAWFEGGSTLDLPGSYVTYAPDAVPASKTSWGQIKATYR